MKKSIYGVIFLVAAGNLYGLPDELYQRNLRQLSGPLKIFFVNFPNWTPKQRKEGVMIRDSEINVNSQEFGPWNFTSEVSHPLELKNQFNSCTSKQRAAFIALIKHHQES